MAKSFVLLDTMPTKQIKYLHREEKSQRHFICVRLFFINKVHCCYTGFLRSTHAPHCFKKVHVFMKGALPSSSPDFCRTTAPPLVPACTAQVVCNMTGWSLELMDLERIPQVSDGPQLRPIAPYPTTKTGSPAGNGDTDE